MGRLSAAIIKELLSLSRDRSGLVVLFLMPAFLVIVVSLVQENVLTSGEVRLKTLFIQQDAQTVGRLIEETLQRSHAVELVKEIDGRAVDEDQARELLNKGAFQICIIIPRGLTQAVDSRLEQQVHRALTGEKKQIEAGAELPGVAVYFDPVMQQGFRMAVENLLYRIVLSLEIEMKASAFSTAVSHQVNRAFEESADPDSRVPSSLRGLSHIQPRWGRERLLDVVAHRIPLGENPLLPTTAQQNVPAWALFGMFFVVVPLGGALIREKQDGTLIRLLTLPVGYIVLIFGKVIAYVMVCIIQFFIILAVGKYVLPALGTQALEINSSLAVILLVVVSAGLAAAGYGVMLGTVLRTYEQVSMLGPVSIVIAAALGGIMVPVHLMPEFMQRISSYSPLGWGLEAMLGLFVRRGDLAGILAQVLCLLAFAAGTLLIAWGMFIRGVRCRR